MYRFSHILQGKIADAKKSLGLLDYKADRRGAE